MVRSPPDLLLPGVAFRERHDLVAVDTLLRIEHEFQEEIEGPVLEPEGEGIAPGLNETELFQILFIRGHTPAAALRKHPFNVAPHPSPSSVV